MRANCESIDLRQRAGERGLADARIVLDEDVTLGEHRDDDVLEHLVAHLDRAADVVLHALGDRGRLLDLLGSDGVGTTPLDWLHQLLTFTSEDERRLNTASRTFAATAALVARGTWLSPSAVTIVTSLSGASNAIPGAETSLTTTASRRLRSSLSRACSTARSPDSAAKPTSSWPGRRSAASAVRTSSVCSSSSARRRPRVGLLDLVGARLGRAVVGDGGGHQQDVGGREALAAGGGELGGGGDVDVLDAGRARQATLAATTVTLRAAARGLLGERPAHLPGAAVADEADGVDRLARAAGGDEDVRAVELTAGARRGAPRWRPAARPARAGGRRPTPPASRARRCRARAPRPRGRAACRGSRASPDARTSHRSWPERRAAARRHASAAAVRRLSAWPPASLAIVLADAGAIT